jgi:hypothetical protein
MSKRHDGHDELQDAIEGLDEVIQVYEKTRDLQPPKHINDHIRAAARAAVGNKPARGPMRSGWLVPLSLAATLVIAIGVVQFYPGNPFDGQEIDSNTQEIAIGDNTNTVKGTKQAGKPPRSTTTPGGTLNFDQPATGGYTTLNERFRNNPTAWLQHITLLQRDGKIDEAREQLAAFKQAFPKHRLPLRFRKLLNKD